MESGSKTNVRILLYVGRNIIDAIPCIVDVGMIPFIITDKRKKNSKGGVLHKVSKTAEVRAFQQDLL